MTTTPTLRVFTRRGDAEDACRGLRRLGVAAVVVDGPNDEEWTVMAQSEADDHGFGYTVPARGQGYAT